MLAAARAVARTLAAAGHDALFAGGCVRDALLGRPLHDIDIATSATPGQVEALFPGRTVAVGKSFGIIVVREGGFPFDVATFRSDGGYADGRHPDSVRFSTPEEDALRRDFTVNGLFCDPVSGAVTDFVGGLADLEARVVRTIGDAGLRFAEDRLRMLRAVRFASVLSFSVAPGTLAAIRARAGEIRAVSRERIAAEMTRLLCESPRPSVALGLLRETGLLKQFLPEADALHGVRQPPRFHPEGTVWTHTCRMLDSAPAPRSPGLAWSLLLHDIGKPPTFTESFDERSGEMRIRFVNHAPVGADMAEKILRRLKMPNALVKTVCAVVRDHMRFCQVKEMRRATLRRLMGAPGFPLLLEVLRLDLLHSNGDLSIWRFLSDAYASFKSEPILPPPLVKGRDLIAWGMAPGPEMGEWLARLYNAQLENAFSTPEGARAWLAAARG